MDAWLHLDRVLLDVGRWERETGMHVEGVLGVPMCEFEHVHDWVDGAVLRKELAWAVEAVARPPVVGVANENDARGTKHLAQNQGVISRDHRRRTRHR